MQQSVLFQKELLHVSHFHESRSVHDAFNRKSKCCMHCKWTAYFQFHFYLLLYEFGIVQNGKSIRNATARQWIYETKFSASFFRPVLCPIRWKILLKAFIRIKVIDFMNKFLAQFRCYICIYTIIDMFRIVPSKVFFQSKNNKAIFIISAFHQVVFDFRFPTIYSLSIILSQSFIYEKSICMPNMSGINFASVNEIAYIRMGFDFCVAVQFCHFE